MTREARMNLAFSLNEHGRTGPSRLKVIRFAGGGTSEDEVQAAKDRITGDANDGIPASIASLRKLELETEISYNLSRFGMIGCHAASHAKPRRSYADRL